ncbi:MAG: hypothetical protein ACRDO8_12250, partial [Nocardioidaceae bacterium]
MDEPVVGDGDADEGLRVEALVVGGGEVAAEEAPVLVVGVADGWPDPPLQAATAVRAARQVKLATTGRRLRGIVATLRPLGSSPTMAGPVDGPPRRGRH